MVDSYLKKLQLTNDRHRRRTESQLRVLIERAMIDHNIRHLVLDGKGDLGVEVLVEWDDELEPLLELFPTWTDTRLASGRQLSWTDPTLVAMRNEDEEFLTIMRNSIITTNIQNVYGPNSVLWFECINGSMSLFQTEHKKAT